MFLRRLVKRWKAPSVLLLMVGLLWLAFLVSDKRTRNPSLDDYRQKLKLTKTHEWRHAAEDKIAAAIQGHDGEFLGDEIILPPLARGGPMPVAYDLEEEKQQPNEEENAAREEVDGVKEPENVKVDDNAAREEHSGEAMIPGVAKNNPVIVEVGDVQRVSQKETVEGRKSVEAARLAEELREQEESFHQMPADQSDLSVDKYNSYNNWRNLTMDEISKLSLLGRRIFLNEKVGQEQDKMFKIHIWKYKKHIERRLLYRYGKQPVDPFEECSVSNCKITSDDSQITEADAVLFHLHRIDLPPANVTRKEGQLWVWLSDESPYNVFMVAKDRNLAHYSGYFNWSMTYRMDSDVPVPYGRTVPLPKDQYLDKVDSIYSIKEKDIAILGSNCGGINGRYKYIKDLQQYIQVDVYGGCGPLKCAGHFTKDCPMLDQYKFYLSFENSNCDDYITEKVWWNALGKGAVPVVMGASKNNYMKLLPPGSFIFAEDFLTPKHLAEYLKYLLDNPALYEEYHSWRRRYQVLNEHGYFQSPVHHFCRLCEALNYNSRPLEGATADLQPFFDKSQHCYPATWKPS